MLHVERGIATASRPYVRRSVCNRNIEVS